MEQYLNKNIKEVIDLFPAIGDILSEYDVGCSTCHVGTCLLKDIIDIHNLTAKNEKELMAKIAKVIYPDREVEALDLVSKSGSGPKEISYSAPMQKLVDEHVLIKRLIAIIPKLIDNLDVESPEGRQLIINSIDFIRSYADKYHHAKEEDILFKYFDESTAILQVMHEDHRNARAHVKAIVEALDSRDKKAIAEHLNAYQAILSEHIKKEDEILYPWMDRNLSYSQIGKLFSDFNTKEVEFEDIPTRSETFIKGLEVIYKPPVVVK
ncbi:MAG: hypothetical protein HN929_09970 [Chloroflexi bacterium]|jgi:hemerythrin-like domain-containing protein|nr:hypothetical protein [Chloroflexota bacterium]MBT7081776.1 hypothetical protein [Chloroflexota bacterium]MBT7289416.1 hypothetical protein [Chloroflexota bacterium]